MSNGVEVIVAGDKSALPGVHSNAFRILSNSIYKSHLLAPTTLKEHMMLVIPSGNDQNKTDIEMTSSFLYPNQFVTKTCLTTYTYLKTYILHGESKIESFEKVISNIATEEKNYVNVEPTLTPHIILSKVPNLAVGTLQTTYTYLNTVNDDIPVVITSKHTVINTITAPDDYLSLLQPSEYATPVTDVNTYYNTIELTKTLSDLHITKRKRTKETITQVIITESLPQNHITLPQTTIHQSVEEQGAIKTNDIFKTYFVTYTYYNTFLDDNNRTIVRTNVSTTSQVDTKKMFLFPSTSQRDIYKTRDQNFHIYSTRTYLTTFKFFTTLSNPNNIYDSTVMTSNTSVIENIVTESIPMNKLDVKVIEQIRKQLMTQDDFVTLVHLSDGENINVTAVNLILPTKVNKIMNTNEIFKASSAPTQEPSNNSEDSNNSVELSDSIESSEHDGQDDNVLDESELSVVVTNPVSENVSNLINSLRLPSLPSLNALGPMINAMAGLIQNNFGRRNSSSNHVPIALPFTQQLNEGPIHGPIYIPVNGIAPPEGVHNELLHINKFGPVAEKWVNEQDQRKKIEIVIGKPTHKASLVNGGIPISPGDVITANSDVIIGKPAVIGPRLPMSHINSYEGDLQPPPLLPHSQYSKSKGIPFLRNHVSVGHQNQISFPIRNMINIPSSASPRPLYEDDTLSIIGSNGGQFHSNIIPSEIFNHNQDEIIEIRKIPEVFSTDLPAIHTNNFHQVLHTQSKPSRYLYNNNILPQASRPEPLLVDLQPSQLANVLIPHGSTSGILFGDQNEPLTNGKYFDAPLPYAEVSFNTKKPILEHSDASVLGYEYLYGNKAHIQSSLANQMKITKNYNGMNLNVSPLPHLRQIINRNKPQSSSHYIETNRIYYPSSQSPAPHKYPQPRPLQPIQMAVKNINENVDSMMAETKFNSNTIQKTSTLDDIESDYDIGTVIHETTTHTLQPVKLIQIVTTTAAPDIVTMFLNNTSQSTMMVPQLKPNYLLNTYRKKNHFIRPNYNQHPSYPINHPTMLNNMRPLSEIRHIIKPRPLSLHPSQITPSFYNPIKQSQQHRLIGILKHEKMNNLQKLNNTITTVPDQNWHQNGVTRNIVKDSKSEMLLNIGEITTEKYINKSLIQLGRLTTPHYHQENDLSEIFDFKETINPHYEISIKEYKTTRIGQPSEEMKPQPLSSTISLPTLRPLLLGHLPGAIMVQKPAISVPETITIAREMVTRGTTEYTNNSLYNRWSTLTPNSTPSVINNASTYNQNSITSISNTINADTTANNTTPSNKNTTLPTFITTEKLSKQIEKPPLSIILPQIISMEESTVDRNLIQTPLSPTQQSRNKTIEFKIVSATSVIITKPSNSKEDQVISKSSFDNSVISISLKHLPTVEYSSINNESDNITDYDVIGEEDQMVNLIIGSETNIHFMNGMEVSVTVATENIPTPIFISATKLNKDTTVFNDLFNKELMVKATAAGHKKTNFPRLQTILTRTKLKIDTVVETHNVDLPPIVSPTTSYELANPPNLYNNKSDDQTVDDILDSYVISYSEKPRLKWSIPHPKSDHPINNDSIYVVLTDKREHGKMTPELPAMFNSSIDYVGGGIDYDEIIAIRDEDDHTNDVNSVMLGGILIASPPHLPIEMSLDNDCKPQCKPSRNEICQQILRVKRCICRPGFARMFPDRLCKPTYTYTINLAVARKGKERLMYMPELSDSSSSTYKMLTEVAHEGIDRMVMQSDFRDVYHDIHITGFNKTNDVSEHVVIEFYLQLSDNADEKRLIDIFSKHLRNNNNSLGGTDLYADAEINGELKVFDFDECASIEFNDCSSDAHCFNLRGTYTCSCRESFIDLSENSIYPGRICTTALIGCEKCKYHGSCLTSDEHVQYCECFQWYMGPECHINLKILLIVLITIGLSLLTLLVICIRVTCIQKHQGQSNKNIFLVSGKRIITSQVNSRRRSGISKIDKKSMIDDDINSETSNESNTLPYVSSMKSKTVKYQTESNQNITITTNHSANEQNNINFYHGGKNDKIMTVMIPRAKYHSSVQGASHINIESIDRSGGGAVAVDGGPYLACSTTEAKLLSYLDSSPTITNITSNQLSSGCMNKTQNTHDILPSGALVSAGFEVSATVGYENEIDQKHKMIGTAHHDENPDFKIISATEQLIAPSHKYAAQSLILGINSIAEDNESHFMMKQAHSTVSEARSYDETTIKPPTKSINSLYEKRSSHLLNDEANTMAERDLGSTFLLPHTHLYKPDRGSDISGFDSL